MKPKKSKAISTTHYRLTFLAVTLLLVVIWLLNIPIAKTLWRHSFDDGTYSHSYLIPFVMLYLYHNLAKIGMLQFAQKTDILKGLILVFSCICLFLTASAQLSTGYWLSMLLVSVASINLLFRFNWYILFPVALLVFVLPVWGALVPLLQNLSTQAVTFIMGFSGIPIYVEEQFITIPAGVFEIAGGCSGLRYLIVSLSISSLFIFLYIQNIKRASLFLTVAILGALLTNWIRITALVVIGDYTDMQSSLITDHNAFGWYLYIPFMLMLFYWGNKLANFDLMNTINNSQIVPSNPNVGSLFILVVCLCASSTTIRSAIALDELGQIKTTVSRATIQPKIHFYSQVKQHQGTGEIIKLTYDFNGSQLDGKPSYYENNLIPSGWKIINSKSNSRWAIYYISNGYSHAVVKFNYEIDEQVFSQLRSFKIARLTMAAKNINQTKLNWQFIPCEKDNCANKL
jgi:exosortase A